MKDLAQAEIIPAWRRIARARLRPSNVRQLPVAGHQGPGKCRFGCLGRHQCLPAGNADRFGTVQVGEGGKCGAPRCPAVAAEPGRGTARQGRAGSERDSNQCAAAQHCPRHPASRPLIWSARRSTRATIVRVGLFTPPAGNAELPPTYKVGHRVYTAVLIDDAEGRIAVHAGDNHLMLVTIKSIPPGTALGHRRRGIGKTPPSHFHAEQVKEFWRHFLVLGD